MSQDKVQRWLPIESNPEVMNKFLHGCGLPKTWAICDVYGLDEDLLAMIPQPVSALLLLFPDNDKYKSFAKKLESDQDSKDEAIPKDLFYVKQTISNACGTVAMLHAVGNSMDKFTLSEGFLKDFLDSAKDLSPEERAEKLENDEGICGVHDTVAKEGQTAAPSMDDKVEHHFIAFVEKNDVVYELDGRKKGPISYGKVQDSFLKTAAGAIKKYMENDPENVTFTVVALAPADS